MQCPDIRVKVTPDLKSPQLNKVGELIWINIESKFRIGGSVLAQSYSQQGNDCPTLQNSAILKAAFNITQSLLSARMLLSGHDISDGGLAVCLLEMAFAGLCGLKVDLTNVVRSLDNYSFETNNLDVNEAALLLLFSEECGWVLEVDSNNLDSVLGQFRAANVPAYHIGQSIGKGLHSNIDILCDEQSVISGHTLAFFEQWERTSFELEKLQMNKNCAIEEFGTYLYRTGPTYKCAFNPDKELFLKKISAPIRVAVIREEGTNGDREMIATLLTSQFEVHDVTMNDLQKSKTYLDQYRGVVFPGNRLIYF